MKIRDHTVWTSPAAAFTLALALGATAALPASAQAREDGLTSLSLEVSAFRNAKGTLNCRLFSDAASFPDGEGLRTVRAAIAGSQSVCVFDDVAPGTYAVAVVHDENSNGRLDKNFLGVPTEGYGVSNNRTYAISSPIWDESRFVVAPREPVVLRVNLRY